MDHNYSYRKADFADRKTPSAWPSFRGMSPSISHQHTPAESDQWKSSPHHEKDFKVRNTSGPPYVQECEGSPGSSGHNPCSGSPSTEQRTSRWGLRDCRTRRTGRSRRHNLLEGMLHCMNGIDLMNQKQHTYCYKLLLTSRWRDECHLWEHWQIPWTMMMMMSWQDWSSATYVDMVNVCRIPLSLFQIKAKGKKSYKSGLFKNE